MSKVFTWFPLALICLLGLSACSPQFSSKLEHTTTAKIDTQHWISSDGTQLPLRKWNPQKPAIAVLIAVHGFNDYSFFINDAAKFFSDHGIAVLSYDQRGFGATENAGHWQGYPLLVEDLTLFSALVRQQYPHLPIYILGESMGGAVTLVTLKEHPSLAVDGIILAAPAVWSRDTMPWWQRTGLWLAAHTIPDMQFSGKGVVKIKVSDNYPMLRELGRDPLVIKETRVSAMYGISNLMDVAMQTPPPSHVPSLLLLGAHDEVIPQEPVSEYLNKLPPDTTQKRTIIHYENGYHMLLRDLQAKVVWKDVLSWIMTPGKPPPSETQALNP